MGKLKEIIKSKLTRELVLYVIFGVFTTIISILVFKACNDLLHLHYQLSNIVSWVLAVLFAYVTNRGFVFESRAHGTAILKEAGMFYAARLFSLGVEQLCLLIMISGVAMEKDLSKIITSAVVIVINYFLSKLIVFRKERTDKGEKQ